MGTDIGNDAQLVMDRPSVLVGKPYPFPTEQKTLIGQTISIAMNSSSTLQEYKGDPISYVYFPYFNTFLTSEDRQVVGVVTMWLWWSSYFTNLLPNDHGPLMVVLENTCTGSYTYEVKGPQVTYVGEGDFHDRGLDSMKKTTRFPNPFVFSDGSPSGIPLAQDPCPFSISVYPVKVKESFHKIYIFFLCCRFSSGFYFAHSNPMFFSSTWYTRRMI
jgi:hypothetical protein